MKQCTVPTEYRPFSMKFYRLSWIHVCGIPAQPNMLNMLITLV